MYIMVNCVFLFTTTVMLMVHVNSANLNKSTMNANMTMKTISYCSFFNNRAPSKQLDLKNCTWYKENACCLQQEIESIFTKVKPLIGSSELCQMYLNKLLCYICSPNQYKFYGKERLTVCDSFCNEMYDACSTAILKGSKIFDIYSNGFEFCTSRRFNIDHYENGKCFHYEILKTHQYHDMYGSTSNGFVAIINVYRNFVYSIGFIAYMLSKD